MLVNPASAVIPSKTVVTVVALTTLAQIGTVMGIAVFPVIAPKLAAELGVEPSLIGYQMMALVTPQWPRALTALLFLVFGASAIGWNGLFLAEVARLSPQGKVSVATSGAMVWNFAGILIGPALFALIYRMNGSYTFTFGLLSLFAIGGFVFLLLTAAGARRAAAAG